jgi:hypothetical protein
MKGKADEETERQTKSREDIEKRDVGITDSRDKRRIGGGRQR